MRLATLTLLLAVAGCATTITPLERDLAELRLTPGPLQCYQQGWVMTCAR